MNEDENERDLTEAEVTSQTRFGPRPPPKGQVRHRFPLESRHIPPSGDVSPDGSRPWPQPSNTSRVLVWGGIAIAAAALTAGAVIAGRQVGSMIAGDDSPRPATGRDHQRELAEAAARGRAEGAEALRREAARRRAAAKAGEARMKSETRRVQRRAKGLVEDIAENTHRLNSSVGSLFSSLGAAMTGFRSVAGQSSSILREFSETAQTIRAFLDKSAKNAKATAEDAAEKVKDEVQRRTHNL